MVGEFENKSLTNATIYFAEECTDVYIPDDVNGDNEVATKDITTRRRYIAGGYGIELN